MKYLFINQENKGNFQFEIICLFLARFALFEYLCYGSTAFIILYTFNAGSTLDAGIWRLQTLDSDV